MEFALFFCISIEILQNFMDRDASQYRMNVKLLTLFSATRKQLYSRDHKQHKVNQYLYTVLCVYISIFNDIYR